MASKSLTNQQESFTEDFDPLRESLSEQIAIVEAKSSWNFLEIDQLVKSRIHFFKNMGLKKGDLICVSMNNSVELITIILAAHRASLGLCLLSPRLPPLEVKAILEKIQPHFYFSDANQISCVSTKKFPSALFLFTSGSTGNKKLAVLSWKSLFHNALGVNLTLGVQTNNRWLLSLPLYHVSGLGILFRILLAKASLSLTALDGNITHLSRVPTQLFRSTPVYKKLQCVLIGGSPIPAFPSCLPSFGTYGLTEMGSAVTIGHQCVGNLIPGREMTISEDKEILVKGNTLFEGYWKNHQIHPIENWLSTKDLGIYCPEKGLEILGRKDWQFISGGENIHPEEIEKKLLEDKTIFEACVIPISDAEYGKRPIAILSASSSFNEKKCKFKLLDTLPKYKIPIKFYFLPSLPKKGFKIDRNKILNLSENGFF